MTAPGTGLQAPGSGPQADAATYEQNVRVLTQVQPWWRVPDDDGRVSCRDGVWQWSGSWGTCQLHGRDPRREARQLIDDALAQSAEAELLVVVGLGVGYLLDELERREWTGRVLAVEPDAQVVRQWLGRRDWGAWLTSGRLRLLVGPVYHGVSECRSLVGTGTADPSWLISAVVARTHPDAATRARAIVSRLLFDARANTQARREHGVRYLLNTLRNVGPLHSAADVLRLDGLARGVPAVVVGAGPSLDHVLPVLRRAREHALIVAVDTALRPLLSAGLEPHVVVALDPSEANTRHLVDLPTCPRVHLVAEGSVDRRAWDTFSGRTFAFTVADHHPWPWLRSLGLSPGRLRAWGSVLTSAFDLACVMGANPVVFVGSDLAFTGGRPYARGVSYEEDWRRLAEWGMALEEQWAVQIGAWPAVEIPDLDGKTARTAGHLVAFRNWLAEQSERMPERTVLNASEAGILHGAGVDRRRLDDLVAQWPRLDGLDESVRAACGTTTANGLDPLRSLAAAIRAAGNGEDLPPDTAALVSTWTAFAEGITLPKLEQALADGLASSESRAQAPAYAVDAYGVADPAYDAEWIAPLTREMRFVQMPILAWQMEHVSSSVRRYRSRTTAARLFACAQRVRGGAVAENGVPLQEAGWIDSVGPGQCFVWRDEVYFASTDGSDPRENGRQYTVLVPAFVAFLESQPWDEIQRLRL